MFRGTTGTITTTGITIITITDTAADVKRFCLRTPMAVPAAGFPNGRPANVLARPLWHRRHIAALPMNRD